MSLSLAPPTQKKTCYEWSEGVNLCRAEEGEESVLLNDEQTLETCRVAVVYIKRT